MNRAVHRLLKFLPPAGLSLVPSGGGQKNAVEAESDPLVDQAHKFRLGLTPPSQSNFRVVSILEYRRPDGVLDQVVGCNVEMSSAIYSAMCAERSALHQLRTRASGRRWAIERVVVVTDAPEPIACGALCREMLSATARQDTPVVLAGSGGVEVHTTVGKLYPHDSVYATLSVKEQLDLGPRLFEILEKPSEEKVLLAYLSAVEAAACDKNCAHPISYGAAVIYDDGSVDKGYQLKGLEYGCTLDAVSGLLPLIASKHAQGRRAEILCHVDQFGVLHAPFGAARALLLEHDLGESLSVFLHDEKGCLVQVPCADLLPDVGENNDKNLSSHLSCCRSDSGECAPEVS